MSQQLIDSLSKKFKSSSNKKQTKYTLKFDHKKLDTDMLNEVKFYLGTDSNKKALEAIFSNLASDEISKERSIYHFASHDYLDRLYELSLYSKGESKIYIPSLILIATSNLINEKYKNLDFKSVEDVINYLIQVYYDKINYLWNPE
ncbi:MAG TPA: hypothetical protein DCQ51_03040 [Planktothrix sp. UBA8407]|jgi:hypothetical protein|nr:hypothetical protein [Planktothrix sp. UBA8402]HAO10165.1 hypothetical protein [Planktothrix sp. UBA8407]HBK21533.1 hypothetical protein [Planktothrix sp. UBA10369]